MKALDWLLSAVALIAWAIFCHFVRGFPVWITIIEIVVAILMLLTGPALHFIRSWSTPSDEQPTRR